MELLKIEKLLQKYFDGETSTNDEKELRIYFLSENVAHHLMQYKVMFAYYQKERELIYNKTFIKNSNNTKNIWISVAATVVIALGFCTYYSLNEVESTKNMALGTYENPEKAFEETQKALAMLSTNVNVGIESVQYVREFETSKNRIFKN
jgi:heme/copper-type cytochrome/quinol oxidase subunit 2